MLGARHRGATRRWRTAGRLSPCYPRHARPRRRRRRLRLGGRRPHLRARRKPRLLLGPRRRGPRWNRRHDERAGCPPVQISALGDRAVHRRGRRPQLRRAQPTAPRAAGAPTISRTAGRRYDARPRLSPTPVAGLGDVATDCRGGGPQLCPCSPIGTPTSLGLRHVGAARRRRRAGDQRAPVEPGRLRVAGAAPLLRVAGNVILSPLMHPHERTLTAVQSPLSPGETRDRAVLLMSGSAEAPGLPPRIRLHLVGEELYLGRAPTASPFRRHAAVLEDGLASSGKHARVVRGAGGFDLEDLGQQDGTFVDNVRAERPGPPARRGAGLRRQPRRRLPMVSTLELDAMKSELVNPRCPRTRVRRPSRSPAIGSRRLSVADGELFHRRRDRRGQGGLRPRRPPGERPQGGVRRHQLRRDPARSGRERAVRLSGRRALDRPPGRRRD